MAATQRRYMEREMEPEGDVKGVIVLVVCAIYAISLFIAAAVFTRIFKGVKSSFSELWTHAQIADVVKEDKYDFNHNLRPLKHSYIGSK